MSYLNTGSFIGSYYRKFMQIMSSNLLVNLFNSISGHNWDNEVLEGAFWPVDKTSEYIPVFFYIKLEHIVARVS